MFAEQGVCSFGEVEGAYSWEMNWSSLRLERYVECYCPGCLIDISIGPAKVRVDGGPAEYIPQAGVAIVTVGAIYLIKKLIDKYI